MWQLLNNRRMFNEKGNPTSRQEANLLDASISYLPSLIAKKVAYHVKSALQMKLASSLWGLYQLYFKVPL